MTVPPGDGGQSLSSMQGGAHTLDVGVGEPLMQVCPPGQLPLASHGPYGVKLGEPPMPAAPDAELPPLDIAPPAATDADVVPLAVPLPPLAAELAGLAPAPAVPAPSGNTTSLVHAMSTTIDAAARIRVTPGW